MRVKDIIAALPVKDLHGAIPDCEAAGLAYDSRHVKEGDIFAALVGNSLDGHEYLPAAKEAGACMALVEEYREGLDGWCQVEVPDTRQALAKAANIYFGRASRGMTCVGITGTNGKTTVSYFVEAVLGMRGSVGVMGTVAVRFAGKTLPSPVTTPESVEIQGFLAQMRGLGVKQAVMEISSHALTQHRADYIALDAAVFTNLSRDHLDYHGGMEDYFLSKSRLFTELLPASKSAGKKPFAVVCIDNDYGLRMAGLAKEAGLTVWTYGFGTKAMLRAETVSLGLSGGTCRLSWPGDAIEVRTPMVARYNLQNLAAAAAVGLGLGMDPEAVQHGLESLEGVPGRLERVGGGGSGPSVFVDYSHTDDALTQVLAALRPLTKGRLICVFGAGGDRDKGKRPLMGRAVAQGADLAVITSDNPRTEEPMAIISQIEGGVREAGWEKLKAIGGDVTGGYLVQADRARAISLAVAEAAPNDVVLIAGKGHEDYQIIGTTKRHFDDRQQAAAALTARQPGRWGDALAGA